MWVVLLVVPWTRLLCLCVAARSRQVHARSSVRAGLHACDGVQAAMPRGGARRRTAVVRETTRKLMVLRWWNRKRNHADASLQQIVRQSGVCLVRADESNIFSSGNGAKSSRRTRRDEDISSDAIVLAAFAGSDAAASRATGLGDRTVQRCRLVVSAALAELQEEWLSGVLGRLHGGFLVVKRSSDETPFRVLAGHRKAEVSIKLFNQCCFLLWSAKRASRCISQLSNSRTRAAVAYSRQWSACVPRCVWSLHSRSVSVLIFVQVHLLDNCSANGKLFEVWALVLPCANVTTEPL